MLWGLLRATKCASSEKRESDGAETIGGHRNQKMEFVVGDYRGGRATAVDGLVGGVLACLGWQYRRRKKNTIRRDLRWPPNHDET